MVIKSQQETNPDTYILKNIHVYVKFVIIMVIFQASRKRKTTTINGTWIFGFSLE